MKAFKKILFQLIFWAIVWVILALGHENKVDFLEKNWMICVIQVIIIVTITVTLAQKILSKKNTKLLIAFGLISLLLSALLAYQFSVILPPNHPPQGVEQHSADELPLGPPDGAEYDTLEDSLNDDARRPPIRKGRGQLNPFGRLLNSPFLINFLLLCLTFVLTSVIEIFLFAKRKEADLILSKTETLETELKLLKSQINPHFLFNALNNIYALSAIDANKTQKSISYLSNMLRYVLYECERPYVSLQKEVDYIEDYIRLFVLKSSKDYPIYTAFSMADAHVEIAPMLLIPFVENAFKHSNIEKIDNTLIKIQIDSDSDQIVFKIENTLAENEVTKDEVGGIGLENVKKRLAILYPNKHTLNISEENEIFKVELILKIHA